MNDVTNVTIDVRNVIKRYGDFTALHKISMVFWMTVLRYWAHLAVANDSVKNDCRF